MDFTTLVMREAAATHVLQSTTTQPEYRAPEESISYQTYRRPVDLHMIHA